MKIERHPSGVWHATMRFGRKILLGYGNTRAEAFEHCIELIREQG